ncbi:MAG: 23S rRNA (pseudouridine(1915)-N(3))-methyltransferase RlmH [Patescibacteria group bacterium]
MQNITIIVLGKLKENYWRDAETEYLKRLAPFAKLKIIELREEPFSEKDALEKVKEKEAIKILKTLEKIKNPHIIALDQNGTEFFSEKFSERLYKISGEVVFILGGPLGLHGSIKNMAKEQFSLSRLTFTHQMARVILLEQIYRAAMIKSGRKYHY